VPVVTYVAPSGGRAASAGFFLLEAGDVTAMAPGTNTGAAHPVAMGGEMDPVMKQKVENDAAAYLRSICTKRGRNSALAETAVRESKSFTEREALDQHLVDLIASSDADLLAALDGRTITRFDGSKVIVHTRGASIEVYQRTLRQRIIAAIADPNIALVLLVLGALGIYVEFSSPGLIAPGVIGAILALLGLSALSVLPINWLGAGLLILALALFVLEAKFTSHGILGIGGAVAMVLGAVILVNGPIPEMRIRWSTAIGLALPFSAITLLLLSLVVSARRHKVETGVEGMIGITGSAITELSPEGKVLVRGEYWDAVALRPVTAGARVRITAVDKLKLTVEPVPDGSGGRP
jgi:membrane-bound serine protease (ClpP class)